MGQPKTKQEKATEARRVIDALGGPSKVSALCGISQPSVSEWKHNGIPRGHRNFLNLAHPQVFHAAPKRRVIAAANNYKNKHHV